MNLLQLRGVYFNSLDKVYDDFMADLDALEEEIEELETLKARSTEHDQYKNLLNDLKKKNV